MWLARDQGGQDRRRKDEIYNKATQHQAPEIEVRCLLDRGERGVRLEGVIVCLRDGHRRPIVMVDDAIEETAPTLPVDQSSRLNSDVPDGIKQDVEEAERTHFAQAYKSSVVMCRRAVQLAIEEKPKAPKGRITLGPLLQWAREQNLLKPTVASLAQGVKEFGDAGAHEQETFDSRAVAVVIHVTVEVLNELFPKGG